MCSITAIGHKLQSLADIGRVQGVVMDLKVLDAVALAAKYASSVAIPLVKGLWPNASL